jgi:hypothetical protein
VRALLLGLSSLGLVLLLAPTLRADAGSCWAGTVEVGDGTAAHTFYVQARDVPGGTGGEYVYEESNGIFTPHTVPSDPGPPHVPYWWTWVEGVAPLGDPGQDLQLGGTSAIVPDDTDVCNTCGFGWQLCVPDTLIF